jgi:large subunit ribosomal protein L17
MYKRIKTKKLGRKKTHRDSLVRNLLRSLTTYGTVETTSQKAKVLKSKAEALLGKIRRSKDIPSLKRSLNVTLGKRELVDRVIDYAKGGSVTIAKIGFRDGDNAEKSRVMLVDYAGGAVKKKSTKKESAKREKKRGGETQKVQSRTRVARESTTAKGTDRRATTRSGL